MQKIFKTLLAIFAVCLLSFSGYMLYLLWPSFFPKFDLNTCVEDTQVKRIYLITGYDDRYKGSGVPAVVVRTGAAVPGTYETGTKVSLFLNNQYLQAVMCPK